MQRAHSEASDRSDDIQYSSERKEEQDNGRNAQHERDSSLSRTGETRLSHAHATRLHCTTTETHAPSRNTS
jgi:hypothetical protein